MSLLDNFPPEILWEILNYLDTKQLFQCRLISSQWNEICSHLLEDRLLMNNRDSSVTSVQWNVDIFARAKIGSESSKSLQTLCKWFSPSASLYKTIPCCLCPVSFARVKLNSGANVKNENVLQFLSTIGPFVKCLELEFCNTDAETVAGFWTSINQYMPNIEELLIHFGFLLLPIHSNSNSNSPIPIPINQNVTNKLNFNINTNASAQNRNNNVTPSAFHSLNRSIKRLKLNWNYRFPSLIKYFLKNAPNCTEIIKCDSIGEDFWKVRDLKFWWDMKKLELIKKLEINSFSCSEMEFYTHMLKDLHISSLNLNCQCDFSNWQGSCENGDVNMLNFIDSVYKSSQDTLTSLHVTISDSRPQNICPGHYFRGVALLNVNTVSFCGWSGGDVTGMENLMIDISQLCPNIQCLKIDRHIAQYFAQIIPIVWTHFSKIQSLKIDMNVETLENNVPIVDSVFSGYSCDSLEKIKSRGTTCPVQTKRSDVQIPSILDLKDLRTFQLRFFTPDKLYESCNWKEKLKLELKHLLFVKMLPQHLRENPLTLQINDLNGRFIPIFPT